MLDYYMKKNIPDYDKYVKSAYCCLLQTRKRTKQIPMTSPSPAHLQAHRLPS